MQATTLLFKNVICGLSFPEPLTDYVSQHRSEIIECLEIMRKRCQETYPEHANDHSNIILYLESLPS